MTSAEASGGVERSPSERSRANLLLAAMVVAAIGVGLGVTISYVHAQIDALGDTYTSFCNVNDAVNCDVVLASDYAKIAGLPVAWLATAAYLAMCGLFAAARRSPHAAQRKRLLKPAFALVVGSVVMSVAMLFISLFVLETVCLLCTGLYGVVVALSLIGVLYSRTEASSPLPLAQAGAVAIAATVGLAAVGYGAWSAPEAGRIYFDEIAALRDEHPAFYDWYSQLERTDRSAVGAPDADKPVTIVEFFDFGCGHCAKSHRLLKELLAERGDEVALVMRHFPLDSECNEAAPYTIHPGACRAAEAAECAREQDRFVELADLLFENRRQLFDENLFRLADAAGLDRERFSECMDSRRLLPRVLADTRDGQRLDIEATPTLFVNGRRVSGGFDDLLGYHLAVTVESLNPPDAS